MITTTLLIVLLCLLLVALIYSLMIREDMANLRRELIKAKLEREQAIQQLEFQRKHFSKRPVITGKVEVIGDVE